MSEPVHLQFTQDDRDILMLLDAKLDQALEKFGEHHKRLSSHHRRIKRLELIRDEGRGAGKTIKVVAKALTWAWAALLALAGILGWHVTQKH